MQAFREGRISNTSTGRWEVGYAAAARQLDASIDRRHTPGVNGWSGEERQNDLRTPAENAAIVVPNRRPTAGAPPDGLCGHHARDGCSAGSARGRRIKALSGRHI
jgi:hypothetical protein